MAQAPTQAPGAVDRFTAAIEAGVRVGPASSPTTRSSTRPSPTGGGRSAARGRSPTPSPAGSPIPATSSCCGAPRWPTARSLEFTLTWEENGVPHACHQSHHLTLRDGSIVADTVFCGGRWNAALLAEMAEAGHDGAG